MLLNIPSSYEESYFIQNRLLLDEPIDQQFRSFSQNIQRGIKKAEKNEIGVRQGGISYLEDFYLLYAKTMNRFGTPPHSKTFFKNILTNFLFDYYIFYAHRCSQSGYENIFYSTTS